jgi:quinol-cytochrome oxidoreductase complex cytochrome b subunit
VKGTWKDGKKNKWISVLVGGGAVGQPVLVRFYVFHVLLFPLIGALLMAVHFWRIRKDGGVAGPPPQSSRG